MAAKAPHFSATEFTATQFSTAADKAKFANHFIRFVESGFKDTLFPNWFYTRLSMTFGHIAHFNREGFYAVQCSTTHSRLAFLRQTLDFPRWMGGDPAHTFSDVERALAAWVHERQLVDYYAGKLAAEVEQAERAELARLTFKYGSPKP